MDLSFCDVLRESNAGSGMWVSYLGVTKEVANLS